MSWYLRSTGDRDTHRGVLQTDGTVVATCGLRFVPRSLLLGGVALPGYPQDRDQVCPECDRQRVAVPVPEFGVTCRRAGGDDPGPPGGIALPG